VGNDGESMTDEPDSAPTAAAESQNVEATTAARVRNSKAIGEVIHADGVTLDFPPGHAEPFSQSARPEMAGLRELLSEEGEPSCAPLWET
jgi:hypothetical protein